MSSRHSLIPWFAPESPKRAPLGAVLRSLACATLAGLVLVSCGKPESTEVILARVGEHPITENDFRAEAGRRIAAKHPVPDKKALLEEMIHREALLQRVKSSGLDREAEIQRELDNHLIAKFLERELSPRLGAVQVSAEEIEAAYERHRAKYTQPAKVRLAVLFLEASPKTSGAKRAELRARLDEARRKTLETPPSGGRGGAAMGFGLLAIEYSDDQASRYRGGDIGWLDEGSFAYRWPREVLEIGYAQEAGRVSEIIEAEGGLYLVTKTDYRSGSMTPLEQVHASLRHSLLAEKRREAEEAFRKETAHFTAVSMNREALASIVLPPPDLAVARHHDFSLPTLPGAGNSSDDN